MRIRLKSEGFNVYCLVVSSIACSHLNFLPAAAYYWHCGRIECMVNALSLSCFLPAAAKAYFPLWSVCVGKFKYIKRIHNIILYIQLVFI